MEKCPNCGNEFTKNYCNNCGQKFIKGNLTIRMVLSDFIQNVFLFDSTLYRTLIGLLISPGKLVTSYIEGKRKKYLQPFQFFLLFMTIDLLILSFLGDNFFESINNSFQLGTEGMTKALFAQSLVRKYLNILYFILTPIIAFYIHILYKKIKYNYAEKLIFSIYIMGISFLLSSIAILLGQFNPFFYIFKSIVIFGYLPFAIWQFTNHTFFIGIIKALVTILLSYLTYVFFILIVVGAYVYLFIK